MLAVLATLALALTLLAVPAVTACSYLLLLTLLSARLPRPVTSSPMLRFDVIVPAHNEATVIERTLASLQQLDWPATQWHLLVIADNCSDTTEQLARAAGADVIVRQDDQLRGKGYALRVAFDHSHATAWADAVVVVDADTQVSPNLLEALAARIGSGASAVQVHYGVLNPAESWRSSLMSIAHGAFHSVRSRSRERLHLSCGLRGNGWCITHRALVAVPYQAFSATEDLEYGIALGLAGYRVAYAEEAWVKADMESSEAVARGQRQRWEDGRIALTRSQTLPLLKAAICQHSWVCLDLAMDLAVPPLSYVALNVAVLIGATIGASLWQSSMLNWLWVSLITTFCLVLYVLRGWQLSGRGAAGLFDLLRAPFFVIWKLGTLLGPHDRQHWTPTLRRYKAAPVPTRSGVEEIANPRDKWRQR